VEAVSLDRHQKKVQRLKAHLAFLDESGFLLIPNVRRTWAPRGRTPIIWHRYRHDRISAISAVTVSFRRQRLGLYFHLHRENISQSEVVLFLRYLLQQIRGPIVLLWDGGSIHTGQEIQVFLAHHPRASMSSASRPTHQTSTPTSASGATARPPWRTDVRTTSTNSWSNSRASPEQLGGVHLSCVPSSPAPTCHLYCVRDGYYFCIPQ
jgi:hypothetical protein